MLTYITNGDDIGKLIVRVSVACFVLVYGVSKITNPAQIDYIADLFTSLHLPGFLAYLVYLGEVIAPLAMIIGWRTKIAAFILSGTMVVVIMMGHYKEIFPLADFSWYSIELQMTFLMGALAAMFLGAGKYALSTRNPWD